MIKERLKTLNRLKEFNLPVIILVAGTGLLISDVIGQYFILGRADTFLVGLILALIISFAVLSVAFLG